MRKLLLSAALLASLTTYAADTTPVWCDPSVNQQNREPRRDQDVPISLPLRTLTRPRATSRLLPVISRWRVCGSSVS